MRLTHLPGMSDYEAHGLDRMLTTRELADYLGVLPQVISDMRSAGHGPRAVRIGKELRYRVSDIRSWIDARSESSRTEHDDAR